MADNEGSEMMDTVEWQTMGKTTNNGELQTPVNAYNGNDRQWDCQKCGMIDNGEWQTMGMTYHGNDRQWE